MASVRDIATHPITVESLKTVFIPLIVATAMVVISWYEIQDQFVKSDKHAELVERLETLATKDDLNLMFNELQIQRLEGLIAKFERKGIDNLDADEREDYKAFKKQKETLDEKRRELLGFQ